MHGTRASFWAGGRGARPLPRHAGGVRASRRRGEGGGVHVRLWTRRRRRPHPGAPLPRHRRRVVGARVGLGLLQAGAGDGDRPYAGRRARLSRQRVAPAAGARRAPLGSKWLLPVWWSLRISRPAAGRDGARSRGAGAPARADPTGREPAVSRGGCAALVASPPWPGGANPHLRRLPLPAERGLPVHRGDGRHRDPRGDHPVPRGAQRGQPRGQLLRPPAGLRRVRLAL